MAKSEVQYELSELKYYYARKRELDTYEAVLGKSRAAILAEKYHAAICQAPIRLYDLYIELYINNHTWESLADKWSYSTQYIARQANELYKYLTDYFAKHQPLPAKGVN